MMDMSAHFWHDILLFTVAVCSGLSLYCLMEKRNFKFLILFLVCTFICALHLSHQI